MVLSSGIHTGTPWVLCWAASEHVLIEVEVFSCALKANAWKEFSVLSGSLYAEKRNQVDVGGGSGGTEVQNPMNTEGKYGIVEDWQEREGGCQTEKGQELRQTDMLVVQECVLELLYFAYCWILERNSDLQHPCGAKQDTLVSYRSWLMWVAELVTDSLLCYINESLRNSSSGSHPACDTGGVLCRSSVYDQESKFCISIFQE